MANKTIYVAEEDLSLLEEAQALAGGNLSAAIARALRTFVYVARARQAGFSELTVRVGPPGSKREKRFWGCQMARWQVPHEDGRQMEIFTVYRTKGGRFALHWRKGPNWGWWTVPAARTEDWSDPSAWPANPATGLHQKIHQRTHQHHCGFGTHGAEETLEVFESLDDFKEHIPPELYQMVTEADQEPRLEDLDI